MKQCIKCGVELISGDNWYPYFEKDNRYICKKCHNKNVKKSSDNHSFEQRLRKKINKSLSEHKRRSIEVIGSTNEYIHTYTGKCAFCGMEFDIFSSDKYKTGSLDRINNDDFMTPDTVQWLCYSCNATKSDRSNQEFYNYLLKILPKLEEVL